MSIHFELFKETEVEHGRYFHVYMLVDFIHQDAKLCDICMLRYSTR